MMSDDAPRDGDLVISRRTDDGRFEITVSPGRPQMAVKYKHDAINQAFAYADSNGVTVWFMELTGEFSRVDRVRPKES
jgi:hypothetical protein